MDSELREIQPKTATTLGTVCVMIDADVRPRVQSGGRTRLQRILGELRIVARSVKTQVKCGFESLCHALFGILVRPYLISWMLKRSNCRNIVVIVDCVGRLGNRLTVLANVLAFAQRHECLVIDLCFSQYGSELAVYAPDNQLGFVYPSGDSKLKSFCKSRTAAFLRSHFLWLYGDVRYLPENVHFLAAFEQQVRLDSASLPTVLRQKQVFLLSGFSFRADPLQPQEAELIRQILVPSQDVQARLQLGKSPSNDLERDCLIGVHIRQGDYQTWNDGKFFYTKTDYLQAMQSLEREIAGSVHFLLCSDERLDPADFFPCKATVSYGTPTQDLYALAACDYILATHSSFANWASFFGCKRMFTMRDMQRGHCEYKLVEHPVLLLDYAV